MAELDQLGDTLIGDPVRDEPTVTPAVDEAAPAETGQTSWTSAKTTSTLSTSEATRTLSSATDTWGRTWTASNLTNANFRVRVIAVSSTTSRDFSLDWVAVRVHH